MGLPFFAQSKNPWQELMDQMCMSMVKLQGRLQFSQARAGADGDVDERWWVGFG